MRKHQQKKYRQELVYVHGELKIGQLPPLVDVSEKPDRVWSLIRETDPDNPPELPIEPKHLVNAFMEDYVHDWSMHKGKMRYGSRVTAGRLWLLLEYEEAPA